MITGKRTSTIQRRSFILVAGACLGLAAVAITAGAAERVVLGEFFTDLD